MRKCQRNTNLKIRYGITLEEYNALLKSQDNSCAICLRKQKKSDPRRYCVDHNHTTQEVRGILCNRCNTGIGHFKDNPEVLKRALDYLEERGNYAYKVKKRKPNKKSKETSNE